MENRRAIIISLICLLVSVVLISAYVQVKRQSLTSEFGEEVSVVVATRPIPEYGIIREDMVEVVEVFKNFRQPQAAVSIADVVGKASYVPVYSGEQLVLTKLITQEGKPVLDRQLAKDLRAVTLPIAQRNGVGKLIRPGNRIDILASINYEDPSTGEVVFEIKTVAQNMLVLATGKNIQNDVPSYVRPEMLEIVSNKFADEKRKDYVGGTERLISSRPTDDYSSITLQASPDDAEKLLLISSKFGDGRIYFTLRNSADQQAYPVATVLLDDVLGPDSDYGRSKQKPPEPPEPTPPRFQDNVGGRDVPVK
jgi:pilus assembly protein CpaB